MVVWSRRWRVGETRRTNLVTSESKDNNGALKPSEYVERGQIYVSCEEPEGSLTTISRALDDECVMWASDYPHPDAMVDYPNGVNQLVEADHISEDFKHKILWDNPAKCFHLDVPIQRTLPLAACLVAESNPPGLEKGRLTIKPKIELNQLLHKDFLL